MKTNKAFKKLVQAKTDDLVLKELKRMKSKIGYMKRTRQLKIYEYLYASINNVIIYQKHIMQVQK